MAKTRKGYYRAAHYVKPTSVSSKAKKPAFWVVVVGALLLIAAWNTLFGDDGDKTTPEPQRTTQSVTGSPSR
ncbi:hypothetical protein [Streptomyces sp. NPDC088360]|uniref:hypothetical protein n=1 Tax=Streptomyces sp. NPDC088360 TaxID=3154515 RepID=UPI00344DE495